MLSALDSATVDTELMLLPDYTKNLLKELQTSNALHIAEGIFLVSTE